MGRAWRAGDSEPVSVRFNAPSLCCGPAHPSAVEEERRGRGAGTQQGSGNTGVVAIEVTKLPFPLSLSFLGEFPPFFL